MAHDRRITRGIFISDPHGGHKSGMAPPRFRSSPARESLAYKYQKYLWNGVTEFIEANKPYDFCGMIGDLIDGRGEKDGGRELILHRLQDQCESATVLPILTDAHHYFGVYGTPYHTGNLIDAEDWTFDAIERETCTKVHRKGSGLFSVNGLVIHARHKIARSGVMTGGDAALRRQANDCLEDYMLYDKPLPRLIVRGHAHYTRELSDLYTLNKKWTVKVLPSLQGANIYGDRQVDGKIHIGVSIMEYDHDTDSIVWIEKFFRPEYEKGGVICL